MTSTISDAEIADNLKGLYAEWLLIPNSEEYLSLIKKAIDRLSNNKHADKI